jgi:glyoxylase-like metal-dependent hydrolase (beta-lactamase superfamily II)/rhodanese-related sulfurtransferase
MEEKTITVKKLQEKLNKKESVFILDVRPIDQRKEWKIAGSTHVDAYKSLNAGDETSLDIVEIPADAAAVVTVCAAGRTSLLATELLTRKGVQSYSLEGGMKAWNYAWNKAEVDFSNGTKIIQVRRAAKGVLSYVVGSSNEAIVVDAALDPEVYIDLSKQNGWIIKYVLDTHIHADYVSRTRELASKTGAKHLLLDKSKVDFDFTPVAANQSINFGSSFLQFLHTPGHTWESASFILDNDAAFTGDTLFIDGIGRPDLKAEQSEAIEKAKSLYKSLKELLSLNPSLLVLSAHTSNPIAFDDKLIGANIKTVGGNVSQIKLSEVEFVNYALARIPPTPPNYSTIALINKQGSHEGHQIEDLEAGGNHCAIA